MTKAIRYTGGQGTFAENAHGRWIVDDATFGARKVGNGENEVPEAAAEELVRVGPFEYVKTTSAATATKKAVVSVEKAFRAVEKAHAKLSKAMASNSVSADETEAAVEAFYELNTAIAATYGSLAQAPAKIRKQFEAAEKNFTATSTAVLALQNPAP